MKSKRYGRTPIEEIRPFAAQGGGVDSNNHSDMVFADKLGDYDDPRETYVRRDLEHRQHPEGFLNSVGNRERKLAGEAVVHHLSNIQTLTDNTILMTMPASPTGEGEPTSYYHEWRVPRTGYNEAQYGSVLSPQEHKEMMAKLQNEGLLPTEAAHPMSRSKSLVIFYRRNSSKKYASTTTSRAFGHGSNSKDFSEHIRGTRLGTVLQEIKHGIAQGNPRLSKLVDAGLKSHKYGDVYTAIRDELFKTKDPRAVQLARQYNWHKIGEGLQRDEHLHNFVANSAKGTSHENHHQMFRRFYNGVVHAREGPDENTRQLFYKAMRKHLQDQTGKDHSYEDIEDSLRRLGETEENHEHLLRTNPKTKKKPSGGSKFEVPDYNHPAYTGTPRPNQAPDKRLVTPRGIREPGQFKRLKFKYKV